MGCPVHEGFDPLSEEFLADPYCAAASLGKLEARLALAGLMDRWPELRLVGEQTIPFHPNISFRGPLELWVRAA